MIPKIFINLDGGIIQNIICDSPVEVIVADFDIDGLEEDHLTKFIDDEGKESVAYVSHMDAADRHNNSIAIKPEVVSGLFKNIKEKL